MHLISFTNRNVFWLTVVGLVTVSLFFTYRVETFRGKLHGKKKTAELKDGQLVKVPRVLDGDDISVKSGERAAVVRLRGIKAFNVSINEPDISTFGKQARDHLIFLIGDKPVKVILDEKPVKDRHGRYLATVQRGQTDIGRDLVVRGLAVVFRKYPFKRMAEYIKQEDAARKAGRGLWGNDKARQRADAWRSGWAVRRKK